MKNEPESYSGASKVIHGFFQWVTAHPILVIALCLAATGIFAYGLKYWENEAAVENMLPTGHESVLHLERIDDVFEIEESVAVAVVRKAPGGIYTPHTLKLIETISRKMEDIRGVDMEQIQSLFTVDFVSADQDEFGIVPLCDTFPETKQQVAQLRNRVETSPMFHGTLVSENGAGSIVFAPISAAVKNVQEDPDGNVITRADVYFDVMEMIESLDVAEDEEIFVTGAPVITGVIGHHVEKDLSKMMPLVSVVIILMLVLIFRSVRGVALPLLVVMFSVVWALGLMFLIGIPIYPMTTIVPIVVMAIGVADGIHILARYNEGVVINPNRTSAQIAVASMMEMWRPVVMTSLTTTVGFLSLLTSSMKPIFYTGIFTSVGVMAAMIFSLTFVPACLALMKVPKTKISRNPSKLNADRLFEKAGGFIFKGRPLVTALGIILLLTSFAGMNFINVDSDPMANFNQNDPIPVSTTMINELFSGAMIVYTTFESDTEKRFLEPDVLKAVERYQQDVAGLENVGATISIVDFLKMMHSAYTDGSDESRVVPPSRNLVGTYLMQLGENGNHYINYGRNFINVNARLTTTSTKELEAAMVGMDRSVKKHFAEFDDVTPRIGGIGRVLVDMINILVYGQITSVLLSICGVFLITALMFRSLTAGLFNIIPIGLATALNFGIMGLAGIPLEPATAITSCIGIGVGIDYAIHFIAKFQLVRRKGHTGRPLVQEAMSTAGKAIFFNAAVVIAGFMVLSVSQFPPSRHMGFLISLNMFTSFAAAVTVLPALLSWIDPKFCKKGADRPDNIAQTVSVSEE